MRRTTIPAFLLPHPLPRLHPPRRHNSTSLPRATAVELPPSLSTTSVTELSRRVRRGEISAVSLVEASLSRIESIDEKINAFITVESERALYQAEEIDRQIRMGKFNGPLCGIPIAVKDNLCTKGIRTTAGSAILDNFIPTYTATVIERMEKAGAIIIGKTNMDEFGMGCSTELSAYGATRNPCDLTCVSGGSSGGSAAAVSGGMTVLGIGSDTGGSIRLPAAFCEVSGFKPSYGRWSRYGLLAYGSSFDCVGVLGREVEDLKVVDEVVRGGDGRDSTCWGGGNMDIADVKVGVVRESLEDGVDRKVVERIKEGMKVLGDVKEVSVNGLEEGVAAYYVLTSSEASANLARYDGVRYGMRSEENGVREMYAKSRELLGREVKKRIMMGTYALSSGYYDEYYLKAQRVRRWVVGELKNAMRYVDVLIMPASPGLRYKLGNVVNRADLEMYLGDIMTIPASLGGLPAVCVPVGEGVGMQIIGRYGEDDVVFKVASELQKKTQWHLQQTVV